MTDTRKVLQQALEALEYASTGNRRPEIIGPAIEALRSALSQQGEQQPVAWLEQEWSGSGLKHLHFERREPTVRDEVVCPVWTPLYAGAAPAAQPLTEEQITEHFSERVDTGSLLSFADGVRFAERHHGIGADK